MGCPILTQGILQLTVSAKSCSYSTFPMASTQLIGMWHFNVAERNLRLNPSTVYWLPPTHSLIGISEMFAIIAPNSQLILSTYKYISTRPSNLQLSPHTVWCAALFLSGRSHGNFFGEIFSIMLSIYKVNCWSSESHHQSWFKQVWTYVSRLELQTEPASDERTRTRLNLRFSLAVQGLNWGSGPNFGNPRNGLQPRFTTGILQVWCIFEQIIL